MGEYCKDPISQIVNLLKWNGSLDAVYKPTLDWRTNIEAVARTMIYEFAIKKFKNLVIPAAWLDEPLGAVKKSLFL